MEEEEEEGGPVPGPVPLCPDGEDCFRWFEYATAADPDPLGTPIPGELVPAQLHWNSYVVDERTGEREDDLQGGETYQVHLDLSAFDYTAEGLFAALSAVPGPELPIEIAQIQADELTVYIQPVAIGAVELMPGSLGMEPFLVKLDRIKNPPEGRRPDEAFEAFVDRASALEEKYFRVKASREGGCAALGFSIWDRKIENPLDHVVLNLRVAGEDGRVPACEKGRLARGLSAGLLTLVETPGGRAYDASLHIFELKLTADDSRSIAVYVGPERKPLSWPISETLTDFVGSGLGGAIRAARGGSYNFASVASVLEEALFTSLDSRRQADADAAIRSLRFLAAEPETPAVLARLVDKDGAVVFLPFGLLASEKKKPLGESVDFAQPLRRARATADDACIPRWTFAIPTKEAMKELGEKGHEVMLSDFEPVGSRVSDIEGLDEYFGGPGDGAPEGLVLLAHHDDGAIWFDPSVKLRTTALRRGFGAGSFVALLTCSAADPSYSVNRMKWLRTLHDKNVDVAVVSVFDLPIGFAARFASLWSRELAKVRKDESRPTIGEIFRRTVQAMRKDVRVKDQADAAFELVLVGNRGVRACPESSEP